MKSNQKGFSLTEIIVAIAVITVLAGAMTPLVFKQIGRSRVARVGQDLDAVKAAFLQYYADTNYWPCKWNAEADKTNKGKMTTFTCLYADDKTKGWDGPYLEQSGGQKKGKEVAATKDGNGEWFGVVDAWGNPYNYYQANTKTKNASSGTIVIFSAGENGKADTKDTDLLLGKADGDDVIVLVTRRAKG